MFFGVLGFGVDAGPNLAKLCRAFHNLNCQSSTRTGDEHFELAGGKKPPALQQLRASDPPSPPQVAMTGIYALPKLRQSFCHPLRLLSTGAVVHLGMQAN
jgi:hypothetical protein